jgi:hypothetical protein
MTYFWIFFNVHLNIIVSKKKKINLMFLKRYIKKILKRFFLKQQNKKWSKGACVVGPHTKKQKNVHSKNMSK